MASADATAVLQFLDTARRRHTVQMALKGAAIGLGVATVFTLIGWPVANELNPLLLFGLLAGAGGGLRWALLRRASNRGVAARIEAGAPECHNLLITASELLEGARVEPYVEALVHRQAAARAASLRLPNVLPFGAAIRTVLIAAVCWGAAVAWRASTGGEGDRVAVLNGPAAIDEVTLTVTPPAYLGQPTRSYRNPARVEALRGSRIGIAVRAHAATVALESHENSAALALGDHGFTGEVVATTDGFLAFEPARADGQRGDRRLVGLTVLDDRPPTVVIRTPGRDLHFPDAARTVSIAIDASDDFALASLKLGATTVSGSGERFSFAERDVPITITRRDASHWTAAVSWRLATLGLEPGDMVVYRAVATDRRPGAAPVESDAWIVEITAPGSIAASGFEIDQEQNRYAVSQQMVILKTERLLAGKARLSAELFADSAAQIAMEQRRVRAEFVFMMGGEVDDGQGEEVSQTDLNEVAEAEGEDELAAGRLLNAGRLALVRGIRNMSRAATMLGTGNVPGGLVEERKALVEIEKAFSHSRIILRALTQREALDYTRRLSGALTDAASTTDVPPPHPSNAKAEATRRLLAAATALPATPPRASVLALAEAALRIDPSDKRLQAVAAGLTTAADELGRGRTAEATRALDQATTALAAMVGADAPRATTGVAGADARRLRSRLAEALRAPSPGVP
jgi:hypothetical protein